MRVLGERWRIVRRGKHCVEISRMLSNCCAILGVGLVENVLPAAFDCLACSGTPVRRCSFIVRFLLQNHNESAYSCRWSAAMSSASCACLKKRSCFVQRNATKCCTFDTALRCGNLRRVAKCHSVVGVFVDSNCDRFGCIDNGRRVQSGRIYSVNCELKSNERNDSLSSPSDASSFCTYSRRSSITSTGVRRVLSRISRRTGVGVYVHGLRPLRVSHTNDGV